MKKIAAIEDDYVGPQLEDGKVTLKFMEELMEFYKDQKKLHRKFAYKVSIIIQFNLKNNKKKKMKIMNKNLNLTDFMRY